MWFAATDKEYHGLFRALERSDWIEDTRFGTVDARNENAIELGQALYDEFRKWETRTLYDRMVEEDVPVGPVHSIDEMLEDAQIRHNGMIEEREHPIAGRLRSTRGAARFSTTPQETVDLAPALGAHTDQVLHELAYDAEKIAALRRDEVIA